MRIFTAACAYILVSSGIAPYDILGVPLLTSVPPAGDEICGAMNENVSTLPSGSLWVWGVPFGVPGDNTHVPISCSSIDRGFRIQFDEGEFLTVIDPQNVGISDHRFIVEGATIVSWSWYHYGRPKLDENLRYVEYKFDGTRVEVSSNHENFSQIEDYIPSGPAVLIE